MKYDTHLSLVKFGYENRLDKMVPEIRPTAWVAPSATIVGNVHMWNWSSVWYGAVVKGDTKLVRIGSYTNVQDDCVIGEATTELNYDHDGSTIIGHYVTVGHACHINAATVEDCCVVGSHSVLQPGSYMEKYSQLGAGSVLTGKQRIPSGQLWAGNPAKYIRDVTSIEKQTARENAVTYHRNAVAHKEEFSLESTLYQQAEAQELPILIHRYYF